MGWPYGGAFCGESMFFAPHPNASKVALAYLVAHLKRCGFVLFDTQYLNDHLGPLGRCGNSPRMEYRKALAQALKLRARNIRAHPLPSVQDVDAAKKPKIVNGHDPARL